ncbi:MAG: F0F1 ATP synthase subunit A [Cyclobacteriaceae bacterium]|jgi:F-type H+-transporting ATPase subunit a|nr:F0F1 ATP synthase subunit A [Cyclobacteriaceae bacterium]
MSVFSTIISRITCILALVLVTVGPAFSKAEEASSVSEPFQPSEVILHHVLDDHIWHFWDGHFGTLYLPVIVHSAERGLEVFSSKNFYDEHHNLVSFNGYTLDHGHITLNGQPVFDISITKNVAMLFINTALLIGLFLAAAKSAARNTGKAPKGVQAFLEPIVVFVRDEIVKPNIGHHYEKYLPYLLTLFFFILFGNLLGLLPGAGNLTGNIAVTMTLAVFTFIITNVSGNKDYWKHIFWTPGVPLPLRIVILPVEIVGVFTKPFSLMIRLFVAITAGHIVLLSLISLAFIFQSVTVGLVSSLIVLFINLIELLVAGIQAYVFTLFTSLYIGMAIAEHEHH